MQKRKNEPVEQVEPVIEKSKFTKKQLLTSFRFKHNVDLLNAVLKDDQVYTLDEAEALIEAYLKGEVK